MNLYRHIIVPSKGEHSPFAPTSSGSRPPGRNRDDHGRRIAREMAAATTAGLTWLAGLKWTGVAYGYGGFYIEMVVSHFYPDVIESIAEGIEVVSAVPILDRPGLQRVTLFIPKPASAYFEARIARYLDAAHDTQSGPAHAESIDQIERVEFRDPIKLVWTDPQAQLPERGVLCWWEVWVRAALEDDFKRVVREQKIVQKPYSKAFPERIVRWVYTTSDVLEAILANTGSIAELRRGYDVPSTVLQANNAQQADIARELVARTVCPPAGAPIVRLLDTGVNVGHPMLAIATSVEETWADNDAWGTHDGASGGHGTQMAGMSLYGDLTPLLADHEPIELTHRIESYKVMPDDGTLGPDVESYGHVFHRGMFEPDDDSPLRNRIFCSAVTNDEPSSFGLPTSWSGFIDEDCADQQRRRLFIISAGNLDGGSAIHADDYPAANETAHIFDPAQAWNALTVGAYTNMSTISDKRYAGYEVIAEPGALCPQSRTTMFWDNQWPIKPDIVLEGGNFARLPGDSTAYNIDDLSLLSTNAHPHESAFSLFGYTSGAAAQAANMCAAIAAQYPDLWPETIRGIVVHSAAHTPQMLEFYDAKDARKRRQLLARFGHGVPDIRKTLWSLQNDLTMIVQGQIQPFVRKDSGAVSNEIVYYELPWPTAVLQDHAHADTPVTLRVTLSYFVEPNPSRRGFSGRYRYASHGLRFAIRRPGELSDDFKERVNKLERDEDFTPANDPDDGWFLKGNVRARGCLISDHWEGTAAQLADRGTIAIYPIGGWWKTLKKRRFAEREARFSLCVTLDVHDVAIDIYTPIQLQVENPLTLETVRS